MTRRGVHPLKTVRIAREKYGIRDVICSVSCGNDSVASLDLCCEHFDRVEAFFMYFVKGLSFQEQYLQCLEKRYGIKILRMPHWALPQLLKYATFRHPTARSTSLTLLKPKHAESLARKTFGMQWVTTGIKYSDSIERNAQVARSDYGVESKRDLIWPLGNWTHADVSSYLSLKDLPAPPDYRIKMEHGHSGSIGCGLWVGDIVPIKEHYPEDYEKIRRMFPLIDVQIQRYKQLKDRGKLRDSSRGKGKAAI